MVGVFKTPEAPSAPEAYMYDAFSSHFSVFIRISMAAWMCTGSSVLHLLWQTSCPSKANL